MARLTRQLQSRKSLEPVSFKKRAVSHEVPKPNDARYADEKIDLTDLDEILEIDVGGRTCTAEPGVTFDDLVQATLPHGLVPGVVPELRTITIGGAVSGCSLESTSFQRGGFHDTCLEYEVVTATGEVLHATPDNAHHLLFQMMHGSFGTLGIISKLKLRLYPAESFVRMEYERYDTLDAYKAAIERRFRAKDVDMMDGFIFGPDRYVLNLGTFVADAPYTNRYDWMKVYYESTLHRREDYLRTRDYFFRYDNGVTNVHPKTALGRLLFGKLIHSSELLRLAEKLHRLLPAEKPDVTVDMFIPFSEMGAYLSWHREQIGFYPLWCVPYRRVRTYEWINPSHLAGVDDELFIDLAIYGLKQRRERNYYKEIEDELARVHGIKTLISYNYYDEDAFWRTWNKENYTAVKRLTDPNGIFRDLYTKTCRASRGLP